MLLFDEGVAKGTALTTFPERQPQFQEPCTASVLRHALPPCQPDFAGCSWHV